jgi:hypothetical protein
MEAAFLGRREQQDCSAALPTIRIKPKSLTFQLLLYFSPVSSLLLAACPPHKS